MMALEDGRGEGPMAADGVAAVVGGPKVHGGSKAVSEAIATATKAGRMTSKGSLGDVSSKQRSVLAALADASKEAWAQGLSPAAAAAAAKAAAGGGCAGPPAGKAKAAVKAVAAAYNCAV